RDFISYTIDIYTYTGGAHGNYSSIGYNYRLNPLIEFKLEPLLDYDTEVLSTLQSLCKDKLMKKAKEDFEIYSEDEFFFEGSLDLEWNTYENFYLTKDSIVVIFNPYHITAYAFGQHEVDLKFD